MRHWLLAFLLAASGAVAADETVRICHGYGCLAQTDIRYTEGQLGEVRRMLFAAVDAENERKMLAEAVGRLYAWAGEQSDIGHIIYYDEELEERPLPENEFQPFLNFHSTLQILRRIFIDNPHH